MTSAEGSRATPPDKPAPASKVEAGKDLAGRTRPPQALAVPPYETSPSFPSGHTLNSTVIAIVLAHRLLLRIQHQRVQRSRTGSGV